MIQKTLNLTISDAGKMIKLTIITKSDINKESRRPKSSTMWKEFNFQSIRWLITIWKVIWKCYCYLLIFFLIIIFFFPLQIAFLPKFSSWLPVLRLWGKSQFSTTLRKKKMHNIKDAKKTYVSWCVGFVKYTWVCWGGGRLMK